MNPSRPTNASGRTAAFTLVELLVAATIALVIMAALTSLFGLFGRSVSNSQQLIQLSARMRAAAWQLRQDLQGVTTEVQPLIRPEAAAGYFQIIEGATSDTGANNGDPDDILMLTTASPGRPFTGRISVAAPTTADVATVPLESDVAEVAWFCKRGRTVDGVQLFNLYRRQLLVSAAPGVGMMATTSTVAMPVGTTPPLAWDMYFRTNDLSVRREGNVLIANSLADLTRRHSRFMHYVLGLTTGNMPNSNIVPVTMYAWPQITTTSTIPGASDILTGPRQGEDLVLADVTAFDIRVFDPTRTAAADSYVDLGSGGTNVVISGSGLPMSSGTFSPYQIVGSNARPYIRLVPVSSGTWKLFDTWSLHAEWNQLGDRVVNDPIGTPPPQDPGTNWADDNGNGVVDDAGELEQPPPYNVPLRGVEIRLRCYEPSSKQFRQVTIQHSFLTR